MGAAAITTTGFPLDRALVAELLGFPAVLRELLRLHRGGRLHRGRLRSAQGHGARSRPLCARHGLLDLVRGGPAPVLGRLRADQLDHAAETQPRAGRAPSAHGLALRRQVRGGADRPPQHPLHRHERQRARGARAGLRSLRYGGARPDACCKAWCPPRRSTRAGHGPTSRGPTRPSRSSPTRSCGRRRCRSPPRTTSPPNSPRPSGRAARRFATVPYHTFARCFAAATGRAPRLDEAAFRRAVDARALRRRADAPGGPAPAALAASLEVYAAGTAGVRRLVAAHRARDEAAEARLAAEMLDLTEAASHLAGGA